MKIIIEIDSPKLRKSIKSDPIYGGEDIKAQTISAIGRSMAGEGAFDFIAGGKGRMLGPGIMQEADVTIIVNDDEG